jgi:hypothetical protein
LRFFEKEECQADKNWAYFYKKGVKNWSYRKTSTSKSCSTNPIFLQWILPFCQIRIPPFKKTSLSLVNFRPKTILILYTQYYSICIFSFRKKTLRFVSRFSRSSDVCWIWFGWLYTQYWYSTAKVIILDIGHAPLSLQ